MNVSGLSPLTPYPPVLAGVWRGLPELSGEVRHDQAHQSDHHEAQVRALIEELFSKLGSVDGRSSRPEPIT